MLFRQLFDSETSTYSYLLGDEETREAILIDPVKEQVPRDTRLVEELGLRLKYTLETHVHADHVTGAGDLRATLGSRSVVAAEGGAACGDIHVREGDRITFGRHTLEIRETPGHTSGCLSFVLDDPPMVFTGDALLIRGTGRTDFQGGDSRRLYRSIHTRIFTLPDHTLVYPGHDYRGHTVSTVGEEKRFNPRVGGGKTEEEFVEIMANLSLAQPKRIKEAVPANLACGTADESRRFEPLPGAAAAEISPRWVYENLSDILLVDVREPDEYVGELGHVRGSILIPMERLAEAIPTWDPRQRIVTVCRSGRRSLAAAAELRSRGFERVASMRGGMESWNAMALPIER